MTENLKQEEGIEHGLFPEDFLWGAASAALQVEGAAAEGGRGPSIWDVLEDGHVLHGELANIACDEYHRFREDVAHMKEMGLRAYRFSVSWPRVMPAPDVINEEGLQYYRDLVVELEKAGIVPIVTLYHWDLPFWMHEWGGWMSPEIVQYFSSYTKAVVRALPGVKYWMTMNEAPTFTGAGYLEGVHAPFFRQTPGTEAYRRTQCILTRNVLLAHAQAVGIIREVLPGARVGIAMDGKLYVPEPRESAEQAEERTFRVCQDIHRINWWLDPVFGREPDPALAPYLSVENLARIREPLDFVGYNCYKANNLDDDAAPNPRVTPGLPRTAMGWAITPDALYWACRFLYDRYQTPVLITENGMANLDFVMADGAVHDPQRIDYMRGYLRGLRRAVQEAVPVIGYLYWSILDNFEWVEGYDRRFGLIYVDYLSQKRTLKDSAYWYRDVIASRGASLNDFG